MAGCQDPCIDLIRAAFEQRRDHLAKLTLSNPLGGEDLYGQAGLVQLSAGSDPARVNAHLRWVAQWFDHPHPLGRNHKGEVDFAALRLARALAQFHDRLEPPTIEAIERFFLSTDYESMYASENHVLQFHASRLVAAQRLPHRRFEAYGKSGKELVEIDQAWIKRFIRFRARQGWGEFDSTGYLAVNMESLLTVHDFAQDSQLRRMAQDMCNLLLADMAVDMLDGVLAGAHGRSYGPSLLHPSSSSSCAMMHLYFAQGGVNLISRFDPVECLLSAFRPHPLVIDIAVDRHQPYANRERKHLHRCTDALPEVEGPGSIRKYTWWEPKFAIGAVQRQDPYGADSPDAWYARHQQVEWELVLAGNPLVSVFTHHAGRTGEHMYWTGDNRCECGSFFQNGSAVVGVYRIGPKLPFQYIHAHLPRQHLDELVERDGWVFFRRGDVYAGLWAHNGWRWTVEGEHAGREMVSQGLTNAIVCEAGTEAQFGAFRFFADQLAMAAIRFDSQAVSLEYPSPRHGRLGVNANGGRLLDGRTADLEYPTWDSPYLRSVWDSGLVELTKDSRRLVLDFRG
jgi:hypothetical protein